MKKLYLLLILFIAISERGVAQKILMKITSVTAPAGEEVKALEFQINATTNFTSGSGAAVGKPVPGSLMIKMPTNTSTSEMFKKIVMGTSIPEVVFEYYDASNTLYYTITITNAFLTQLYWLSPECPTCLKLEQQLGFVFKTMKTVDANGVTLTWDITKLTIQ